MSTRHEGRLVMSKALVLGAAALALSLVLSAASASAQVYVTPSYGYGYATPVADLAAPNYGYAAPAMATPPPLMWRPHRRPMQRQHTQQHRQSLLSTQRRRWCPAITQLHQPWFRNQCMTTRPAIGVATGMGGARLLLRARARRRGLGIIEPSLLSPRWGGG